MLCCRTRRKLWTSLGGFAGMQALPTSWALLLDRVYSAGNFPSMASPQHSLPALLTTDVRALEHKISRENGL